jgi:hypothetical protein
MSGSDPETIKQRLAARMLELAQAVLPDGRISGHEWVGHGPDGAKWGVVFRGRKTGAYQNFGSGVGGISGLGLIRDAVCAGDFKAAYRWALRFLGEAAAEPPAALPPHSSTAPALPPHSSTAPALPPHSSTAPALPPHSSTAPAVPSDNGKGLYLKAEPFAWDGPAGLYLRGRGIQPDRLAGLPRALRFADRCWHSDVRRSLPAMLAPIIHPATRQHIATHRTYLERVDGQWVKARVTPPKKVLGAFRGGVIPLMRGASRKPLAQIPYGDACLIAEGIENALTMAAELPALRAFAAVSVGNLAAIQLPENIRTVLLIRDADGNNLAVNEARSRAYLAWIAEGREVRQWTAPPGMKDANEALMAEGDHAA